MNKTLLLAGIAIVAVGAYFVYTQKQAEMAPAVSGMEEENDSMFGQLKSVTTGAVDATKEAAADAMETMDDMADKAMDAAESGMEAVGDMAEEGMDMMEPATDEAEKAADEASETMEEGMDKAKTMMDGNM